MKFVNAFIFFTICSFVYSQSKKEQIEILSTRVDSLIEVLNFEKKSNGYIKDIALKAIDVIPKVFEEKYRFLVYDRTTEDFYYFKTPSVKKFRFGTKSLWDLCEELKNDEKSYIASNPYYMRLLKG